MSAVEPLPQASAKLASSGTLVVFPQYVCVRARLATGLRGLCQSGASFRVFQTRALPLGAFNRLNAGGRGMGGGVDVGYREVVVFSRAQPAPRAL